MAVIDLATWLVLTAAGVVGLGLGIGLVVGSAIVRALRGRNDELPPPEHRH